MSRRGPITCLQDVMDRCVVDVEVGCWRWGMAVAAHGVPMLRVRDGVIAAMQAGMQPARRVAWGLAGCRLPAAWVVYQDWEKCTDPLCIAPAHSRAGTWAQRGKDQAASGKLRGDPRRSAAAVRASLVSGRTTPADVVRAIEVELAAGRRQADIAAQFGCDPDTVSKINCRRHPHQRAVARGASVFHQA